MEAKESKEAREERLLAERIKENTLAVQKMQEELRRKEKELNKTKFIRRADWKKSKVAPKPTLSISNETGGVAKPVEKKTYSTDYFGVDTKPNCTTVGDLIKELQKLNPESKVYLHRRGVSTQYKVTAVGENKDKIAIMQVDKVFYKPSEAAICSPFRENRSTVKDQPDRFDLDYRDFCFKFYFVPVANPGLVVKQLATLKDTYDIKQWQGVVSFNRKEETHE